MRRWHMRSPESGMTLVEVLIGTAILMIVSLTVIYTNVQGVGSQSNGAQSRFTCESHAQSILNHFKSIGVESTRYNYVPDSTGDRTAGMPFSFDGIDATDTWGTGSQYEIIGSSSNPALRNGLLAKGSVRALLSIYNSNASFCSNADGAAYEPLNSVLTDTTQGLRNAQTTLRIQAYNINSGALSCPAAPFQIFPMGRNPSASAYGAYVSQPSNSDWQYGLLLTVRVAYEDGSGQTQSCTTQHRFQFQRDEIAPPVMNTTVTANTSNPRLNCAPPRADMTLSLGYNSDPGEKGIVFLCQDVSMRRPRGTIQCAGPSGAQYNGAPPAPTTTIGPGSWVACDKVTACNVSPESSTANPSRTADAIRLVNVYRNIPSDCVVKINSVAVDVAGNSSTVAQLPNTDPTESLRPSCGTLCSPNGWWGGYAGTYPNGYYVCPPVNCCNGPGCAPPGGLSLFGTGE